MCIVYFVHSLFLCRHLVLSLCFTKTTTCVLHGFVLSLLPLLSACFAVPYSISALFSTVFHTLFSTRLHLVACICCYEWKSLHIFAICRENLVYRAHWDTLCTAVHLYTRCRRRCGSKKKRQTKYIWTIFHITILPPLYERTFNNMKSYVCGECMNFIVVRYEHKVCDHMDQVEVEKVKFIHCWIEYWSMSNVYVCVCVWDEWIGAIVFHRPHTGRKS